MKSFRLLLQTLLVVPALGAMLPGCSSGSASEIASPTAALPEDHFTPLVARVATPSVQPVPGTDGKLHVVYEIRLANARPIPATLERVTVVDASNRERAQATFEGDDLQRRLRSLSNAAGLAPIEPDSARQLLVDLQFDDLASIPATLIHRLDLLGGSTDLSSPLPVQQSYDAAPLTIDKQAPIVIGPPLAGAGWVAYNGCCEPGGVHRATGVPVNGAVHFAQRFAIDWLRMDAQGRIVNGDQGNVHNYTNYGADILAVADATVVDVLDELEDQTPPKLPDPSTITLQNVDGNHVVLDLGQGRYAFYAHMKKGTVTVRIGERVTRGQVLGHIGNTGNTSGPHLHFHIMDSPSVLGSSGLPYVFDTFTYAGQVPESLADDFDASWSPALFANPEQRDKQFPLGLAVINF